MPLISVAVQYPALHYPDPVIQLVLSYFSTTILVSNYELLCYDLCMTFTLQHTMASSAHLQNVCIFVAIVKPPHGSISIHDL